MASSIDSDKMAHLDLHYLQRDLFQSTGSEASTATGGSAFKSQIVLGKNDISVLQLNTW